VSTASPTTQRVSLPVIDVGNRSRARISRQEISSELSQLVQGEVRFEEHDRMLYATDASLYQVEPIGVVCPRAIEDAQRVVQYCADHELPILPRGGGTSLAGQTVNHAVVIDFSAYCRRIIEIDAPRGLVHVEPGVVLDQLNAALSSHGLMFGPDVATSAHANIGGMIGNNSAGAYSILYGRSVEHLIGMNVVLSDGSQLQFKEGAAETDPQVRDITQRIANIIWPLESWIEQRFPKTVRHVDGYNLDLILQQLRSSTPGTFDRVNLAHLVCGSEGTLAVMTRATLNLVPLPKRRGLAIISFADVNQALRALMTVLETKPAAVELIDDVVIGLALENREYRNYVELLPKPPSGSAGAVLYVAYFADNDDELNHRFNELQAQFASHAINRYTNPNAMAQAWKLRKAGEPLLHGLHGDRKPITFIEDTAVNPDRLADFVTQFRALVAKHGTTAAYYAHASVGCLHIRPLINIRDVSDRRMMQQIIEEATDLVMQYGGALSGEHGDGRVRSHLLERFYGPEICNAFRSIKAVFDPRNLMNPGNIVGASSESMLHNLRLKPAERFIDVPPTKTFFRYEREHGFGEAVEMCNGAGVCRKMKGGTMCPSYRATLDERHATRGRGNALRLAITGQFSANGKTSLWNDIETKKTLDLCLSCKACKSECPSNVDIAKLKSEYYAQGFARGERIPLASRVFGNIRFFNRLGSAFHPLANAIAKFAPSKAIAEWLLNLHPNRELPRFERSLYAWFDVHEQLRERSLLNSSEVRVVDKQPANGIAKAVVLFPDCFTVYNEPRIGQAAIKSLELLGYRVVLPDLGCCGRASISNGMLGQASKIIRATAHALLDCVQRENAIAVVGCEPSCISAIKDEWTELEIGIDSKPLCALAKKTFLVEQFIEELWDTHPNQAEFKATSSASPVVLHAHCHQKALWGSETSAKILRRIFGDRLHVLDSGCCGMAGSFGYTRDHFEISMRIGEQSLFGDLRQLSEATIVAPGTSCRQQIHDGLDGRHALHPIELIAESLKWRHASDPNRRA
jgi:FAD/FMN-containing dehydrogenase/Fe-S oxidoreductase